MAGELSALLKAADQVLKRESKLITLPSKGAAIFIGDTHGDREASEIVLEKYLKPGYLLIFLGDYVDRGKGHQPGAPLFLFEDRCITLITSSSHAPLPRRIAIADLSRPIRNATDLQIVEI